MKRKITAKTTNKALGEIITITPTSNHSIELAITLDENGSEARLIIPCEAVPALIRVLGAASRAAISRGTPPKSRSN